MPTRRRVRKPFRTLRDLEAAGRASMDDAVWGYVQGAAGDERTLRNNEAAFDRWALSARILRDVRSVDLRTTLLGRSVGAPFFVAPTAYHREIHPSGERATARAAAKRDVLVAYSTLSSDPLEKIAAASGNGPRWFQLYLQPTVDASLRLVERAEKAGYGAIVLTVDTPLLGFRDRQIESGFALHRTIPTGNGPGSVSPPREFTKRGATYALDEGAAVSWASLEGLVRSTSLPWVVKGVLRPEDAEEAVRLGARAIIVSNHGGRQLDRVPATLDALPGIVNAVGGRAEVYLDGGVRRASDILIALALGARAVGLGRPVLWALASGGEEGVGRYLDLLSTELVTSLALLGCSSVAEVDRSSVVPNVLALSGTGGDSAFRLATGRPPAPAHRSADPRTR